jgi:MFS family permease
MDLIIFLVTFAVSYRAGELHMSMLQCAWLTGIFFLMYMLASLAMGRVLSRRNAKAMTFGSAGATALVAILCLAMNRFVPLLAAMAVFGVTAAGFFNAFQTFMRGDAPPGGLVRVTGLYTLAWSSGAGLGSLCSGGLYRLGVVWLSVLTLAASGLILGLLWCHAARPHDAPSAEEHGEGPETAEAAQRRRYVMVAWILMFTVVFVQRPVHSFFPAIQAEAKVSPILASLPLFLQLLLQGLGGGALTRLESLFYRRAWLVGVQGVAGLLLLGLWRCPKLAVAIPGIAVLGLWSGASFFWAVLYASNSGHRSRNVGVNECLVGLGSIATVLVAERVMGWRGAEAGIYAVPGAVLLFSAAVQYVVAGPDLPAAKGGDPNLALGHAPSVDG